MYNMCLTGNDFSALIAGWQSVHSFECCTHNYLGILFLRISILVGIVKASTSYVSAAFRATLFNRAPDEIKKLSFFFVILQVQKGDRSDAFRIDRKSTRLN